MFRFATFLLCLILALSVAARYRAEVSVRNERKQIRQVDVAIAEEERRIQVLRAELAWLGSPERLEKIAKEKTDLEPVTGAQLITTDEFVRALDVQVNAGSQSSND